jgi:plastocyanin
MKVTAMFRSVLALAGFLIAATGVASTASHSVGQKLQLFSPGTLKVKVGDTVTFKNDDKITHHVYSSTPGQQFNLKTQAPGEDLRHTFSKRGRVDVRCGLHPGMRLVVTISE